MSLIKAILWPLVLCLFYCSSSVIANDDNDAKQEPVSNTKQNDVTYETPKPPGRYYLYESFDNPDRFRARWVLSTAKKEDTDEEIAKYNGIWEVEHSKTTYLKGDRGLVLKSKAKHHAIAVALDKPFHFENDPLILQYEVNFQNGQECGGAYLKLLSHSPDMQLENFHDKTPYTIMFGPDKCGSDQKIHFIFRHKNPLNGTITEKHSKHSEGKLEDYFKDKKSHLYTLVIKYDNSYEIFVDQVSVNRGSLLEDFTPPVNPPEEIDDPADHKPESWDEREKIPDPGSKKPEDWDEDAPRQIADPYAKKPEGWLDDEPEMIPDPNAEKPEDWDEEMDGEWEPPLLTNPKCEKIGCGEWKPPMIDNPAYKGKWRPPMIANPNYRGKWKPKKIKNPDYYYDKLPFRMSSIGAVGLELWSMSDNILFDNILITSDKGVANAIAAKTWELKRLLEDKDSRWHHAMKFLSDHPIPWLLYVVYVAIPIIIYSKHICLRIKEESLFKRIITYTNNHPWLWAVYVVVIGLPLVLFIVFCCSSNEEKADQKRAAEIKKTDEVTPDDEPLTTQPVSQGQPVRIEEIKPTVVEEIHDEPELEVKEPKEEINESNENDVDKEKEDSNEKEEAEETETLEEKEDVEVHDGSGDNERSPRKRKPRKE